MQMETAIDQIVPGSMSGIVAFGIAAAIVAAAGVALIGAIALVAGVMRRWRR